MLDLSVIVLTKNEELHIQRCLDNICDIAKEVFVIDCFSSDRTVEIAKQYPNVAVFQHAWPSSEYAGQINWALQNMEFSTHWILRLDADEYLLPELKEELRKKLPILPEEVSGLVIKRRHFFMDKWMRRGTYPVKLLRIFRAGKGVCEWRFMDEHIQLLEGEMMELENDFCDHNLHDLSWFCHKHVDYAIREAVDLLDIELGLTGVARRDETIRISKQAKRKRRNKHKYARGPLFWRSFAYFFYRYFCKGACFEGKEGFLWTFIQGWWYRTLVDAKVFEIKKACGEDRAKIKSYIKEHFNIDIDALERHIEAFN